MNDKDFFTQYTIAWEQTYDEWYTYADAVSEYMLECSDMKEAKALIERIKNDTK